MPFMVRKRAPYSLKKGETFLADNGKRYKVTGIHEITFYNENTIQVIFFGKEITKNESSIEKG
ncbi:hypothetical protein CPT_Silence57 [Bacillus phage Silence]|nr:hypothetical protein CPT_Silence57 [Bacillus phage Silence]